MAMPRMRPFQDEQQYYTYAWFYKGECIYAGFGHAGRCRHVRYKLAKLVGVSKKQLCEEAIIVVTSWGSKKSAQVQERYWIKLFEPKFCIAPGCGSGPGSLSQEGRASISRAVSARIWTSAQREAARVRMLGNQRLLGHKHTAETKQKISAASKGHTLSPLGREKAAERCRIRNKTKPPMRGRMFSTEHRRKLSEARRKVCNGNKSR